MVPRPRRGFRTAIETGVNFLARRKDGSEFERGFCSVQLKKCRGTGDGSNPRLTARKKSEGISWKTVAELKRSLTNASNLPTL